MAGMTKVSKPRVKAKPGRRATQRDVRGRDKRDHALFESMQEGYALCRIIFEAGRPVDFIYLKTNKAFERLTGLKDVSGRKVSEVIPGVHTSNPELLKIYGRVARTGRPEKFKTHVSALGIWLSISVYSPKKNNFAVVFENVTESRKTQAEIAGLAKFPAENPYPVLRLNSEGLILYANRASSRILADWGCAQGQRAPETWRLIVSEALAAPAKRVTEVESGDRTYSFSVVPISEENYVNFYGDDITDRKLVEDALKASGDKFKHLFEYSLVGSSFTFPTGEIHVNKAFCEMLGYSAEELQNHRWQDISHPDDIPLTQRELDSVMSGEREAVRFTKRYLRKDGTIVWADVRTSLRRSPDGQPLYFMTSVVDTTERRRAEEGIRVLNTELEHRVRQRTAQLEEANKELEAFSYSVSHDLRAPLRAIDGFSAALVEDFAQALPPEALTYLARVRSGVSRMAELIEALLRLSHAVRAEMVRKWVDLSALAEDIARKMEKEYAGRRVEWKIEPGLRVEGDPHLLRSALKNLLDNAWKFTSKVDFALIEFGSKPLPEGKAAFFVRDNGAGFDMAYVDKLFVPFERLHTTEEFPGTGIGLATVQRIIHRHGGQAWAEGQVGRGATFFFTLS